MNKYESMTWEELRELPSDEFYKIPKTYLDQAVTEYYKRVLPEESEIFVDDSILLFEEPYENSEDLFYDILPLDDGKLIKLYIHKANIGFIERKRDYASHYLEQVFNNQNNLISEIIKENPYYKK